MSDPDELKQMTERALAAEARVAELLEEQSRVGGAKPEEPEKDRGALPKLPPPPPPPPGPATYKLEQQLKSQEEELARLAAELKEKDEQIAELIKKQEPEAAGAVEGLGAEIENLKKKQAASDDMIERLTQENLQLLEHLSKMKRENDELVLKLKESREEVSIVSQTRQDGTDPKTAAPPAAFEPPRPAPAAYLPPAAYQPPEPEPVRRTRKRSWILGTFLFLALAGAAFLGVWRFFPELLSPLGIGAGPADAVAPEEAVTEPPAPATPEAETPKEPAAETPEAEPEAEPKVEPEKEPEGDLSPVKLVEENGEEEAKKSPAEKRRPKKTAKARGHQTTVGQAKRQIRRMLAGKQLDRAERLLDEWMEKRPQDAGLHYLYGRLHLMRGKQKAAVIQFKQAIELAPKMSSAYHDLGAAYLRLGDNPSACKALGQFLRMQPDHPRAPEIGDLMKQIKCP